jgi:hypothetical protein
MNDHKGQLYASSRAAPSMWGSKRAAVERLSCDKGHADHPWERSTESSPALALHARLSNLLGEACITRTGGGAGVNI